MLKIIQSRITRTVAAAILVSLLAACASIPKQNLDSYVANFNTAKATAQDIYLAAQVQAEKTGGDSNVDRVERGKRVAAAQARLAALDLIDQYNSALVKLAMGTDAAGVKGNLEGLSSGLKSFGVERISSLVTSAVPYLGIISQAVTLIDNAIRAEHFAEAVAAAQRPIQEIIGILRQDADNLHGIQRHVLEITFDQDLGNLIKLFARVRPVVNSLKVDDGVTAMVAGFNTSLARLDAKGVEKPDPVAHVPAPNAKAATADDLALMQALLNQGNALVDSINQVGKKIQSHRGLIEEYKKVLAACSGSLEELNAAVRDGTRVGTLAFAVNVMNLRKAYIEVREAK